MNGKERFYFYLHSSAQFSAGITWYKIWQPFFRENTYILIKKRLNKRFIAQKEDLRGKRRMSAKKLTTTKNPTKKIVQYIIYI